MPVKDQFILALTHPIEASSLIKFWLFHRHNDRDITAEREWPKTGWNRPSMRRCWEFLDLTSRSFSAVIKELDGELARSICLFYLVLRGLDTVEDDMTIPDAKKQPILRNFHKHTVTPGWTFTESGPNENDRQLLVEYNVVVEELLRLPEAERAVIIDICKKMETGMADYCHAAATSATGSIYVEKIEEYDLYCHYVAGTVGEGTTRLFAISGKEPAQLANQMELSNSMGLFLQKTNIIRDFREDADERRYFWPREIWGRSDLGGPAFKEMAEMHAPGRETQALAVLSAMVVDALRHTEDCLDYLKMLKNQTVFNFCAIPQVMAIATLELVFMNPAVFQRNVKIRRAHAAELIMKATNPREIAYTFRTYARKIHAKALPSDPSFLRIGLACGKIEQWCERHYPSFVRLPEVAGGSISFDPSDARTRIVQVEEKQDKEQEYRAKGIDYAKQTSNKASSDREAAQFVGFITVAVIILCLGIAYTAVKVAERFNFD